MSWWEKWIQRSRTPPSIPTARTRSIPYKGGPDYLKERLLEEGRIKFERSDAELQYAVIGMGVEKRMFHMTSFSNIENAQAYRNALHPKWCATIVPLEALDAVLMLANGDAKR